MIDDPPLLTVRRRTDDPIQDLTACVAGAQTGHLVDAMDGDGALDAAIKAVDPTHASFVGTALTCQTGPGDNLAILAALSLARPGDVLMAAADNFTGAAVIGDNVAWMARNAGMAALVTDGAARDVAGIAGIGLPVFARGITPNSCARSGPGRIGLPVVIGGVAVSCGDIVAGDADGVVVIPRARLADVLQRLARIVAQERSLQDRIGAGLTRLDAVAALLASDRVRYVTDAPGS